ncbi:MAG: hypothetical protein UX91_C0005G0073 [Candidatus Amesbacteria bacterium GW2011_GWB1_47_19]|nr:MAG: hypothetical protein UW51_C0007G0073 [Candidatus Amesbacteria bacterium GW2011_GWA1_44_24]KKU31155.1 MAG: hypothetical protein UX46_C0007G0073 [Candidatus Amesbacteria bacterium GW2011_GWC1_46_24]KKU67276.1 MAG: hypothetical protein UX91_C0005G0073 [Candidatus Amesbacteria bacterium GW2011_GWB1_47_19]
MVSAEFMKGWKPKPRTEKLHHPGNPQKAPQTRKPECLKKHVTQDGKHLSK